ncbi:thioredoxin 1 [Syntrophus gentianae]|uniref:Thioredoxin 1 n=1 Tax=Syntrophus gentianae TaxID=43775 RepID=A0A1H8A0D7_9BACT|nr:thioredoxin family protein [Syntrophus gentianae]SEM63007.1 thioredoxin 1 [Syntrophus gentianae]
MIEIRKGAVFLLMFMFFFMSVCSSDAGSGKASKNVPVKGMVTMVDLGANRCIPCKMMAPILEKMEKKYAGKAAIIFLDVWENPQQANNFRIRGIPTQIFFNKSGQEVYRHEGFMSEEQIVATFEKLGVK